MKIEIDLDDILGDENGAETLQDSIRRQVIDSVTATVKKGVGARIDAAVAETIQAGIKDYLTSQMPALVGDVMNAEYTPVSSYGQRGETTTFRKELVKAISGGMVYKKTTYSSDANEFTKAVDAVIGQNLESFKKEFQKQVDAGFTQEAMNFAVATLKKRLGLA